jgi:hypothetical protein
MAFTLGDTITGTFRPRRMDTLRPSLRDLIGTRVTLTCCGVQDEGVYAGQAMFCDYDTPMERAFAGGLWIPEEDIAPDGDAREG